MKNSGIVLLGVGFLLASLAAVLSQEDVRWGLYAGALLVAVIGLVVRHRQLHKEAFSEDKLQSDLSVIQQSLKSLCESSKSLSQTKTKLVLEDIQKHVEQNFPEPIEKFAGARKTIQNLYGVENYGLIMTDFACGERYINRVWSASVDGFREEACRYIDRAAEQFESAFAKLRQQTKVPA